MDTYILSIRSISNILEVFSVDECVACRLVVKKAPIFISSGLCYSSHYGIALVHYDGIKFPHNVVDRLGLLDLLS